MVWDGLGVTLATISKCSATKSNFGKVTRYQLLLRRQTMLSANQRGAFIVLEGCDKSGKTTQSKLLVDRLEENGIQAHQMKFPDRTTPIGKMIDSYLQQSCQLEDHAIHLLFSANRWEAKPRMEKLLKSGVTLVVDRYSFSGVAFSSAKANFSMEWCRQPERGLLKPDGVLYLNVTSKVAAQRGNFGTERYEDPEFQAIVSKRFQQLKEDNWIEINADKSVEEVSNEIFDRAMEVIRTARTLPLGQLWV